MKSKILILLIFFTQNIFSQEYFVKCEIDFDKDKNGVCSTDNFYFENIKIVSPINYTNNTNFSYCYSSYSYTGWSSSRTIGSDCESVLIKYTGNYTQETIKTVYVKTDANNIALVFDADDFQSVIGVDPFGYALKHNITTGTSAWIEQYAKRTVGFCKREGWMKFRVSVYDATKITGVNGSVGRTHCISSINDNISINLSAVNPGNSYLYLRVYTATNTLIKEKYLGVYSSSKSVKFSDLNLQNYWGQDVYFEIRSRLGGQDIYSDKVGAIFFRQIPAPTINVRQRACEPYALFDMTLDSETMNDIANYEFRICKEGDQATSNVFELEQYGSINGNTITLKAVDFQPEDNTNYIIQIYQDVHGSNPPPMNTISCARDVVVPLGFKPDTIAFSNVPVEYNFTDYQNITHTYHITRNGLADGTDTLFLTVSNDIRLNRFEVRKNNDLFWQTIEVKPYDQGVYLYQNLEAAVYHIRAVDNDGCRSEVTDFEIVQPDPLLIDSVKSTLVSCHENNTGADSLHSNAMINTFWNGGIGEYNVTVKNTANDTVFKEQEINTYNKQTLNNLPVGNYYIEVSDNYGARATTDIKVESNPEMILTGVATDYRCNGDGNGTIKLSVQNKTTNYVDFYLTDQAVIHTDDDTVFYNFLEVGNYTASVINTKGCEDIITDLIIDQPNVLELTGTATNPICYNSYEGNIITNTEGGNGNYQYLWSNGETTPDIYNLNSGIYTVTVTDAEECSNQEMFEIIPPLAPTAGWEENSAILCTGNTLTLDGGDFVSYEWQKDGSIISNERALTLSETGVYTLSITDNSGCTATDTFNLELSDHTLEALLLLQDSAGVNELTEVIDVTWPIPDSINWFFDKPVVLNETGNWYQQFLSEDEGIITVTLRAWSDGCYSDSSKTITIFNNENEQEKRIPEMSPLILGFKIYPNPNDGNFRAAVKLSREADIQLKIYSLVKSSIIRDRSYKGLKNYEIPFNLNNLMQGAYIVILTAENERQSLKFIVK